MRASTAERDAERIVAQLTAAEEWRANVQAGLQQFIGSHKLTAARPLRAGAGMVNSGPCRLVGWSVQIVNGTGTVLLRDGRGPGDGDVLGVLRVSTAGLVSTHSMPGPGVTVGEALYAEATLDPGASLVGSYWIGGVD